MKVDKWYITLNMEQYHIFLKIRFLKNITDRFDSRKSIVIFILPYDAEFSAPTHDNVTLEALW